MELTFESVPVRGGDLAVGRAGPPVGSSDVPVVVAAHGITASALGWLRVAELAGDELTLLAPDLRGRGLSAGLPAPFGIDAHVQDLFAVLDHHGLHDATFVGHSMGAYVVAQAAATHPERVGAAVLVDGGFPLPVPEGADVDAVLDATLGPAIARLSETYDDLDAYLAFWRQHPAFSGLDADDERLLERYVAHDLDPATGRSRVASEPVRADGRDLLVGPGPRTALGRLRCPTWLVRAPRGMFDDPDAPLVPLAAAESLVGDHPGFRLRTVEDTNHYTILMTTRGASAVLDAVRAAVRTASPA
ncbi:MAG: alpha/beta fold hydrolase [Actinomycetota bacterium]|nr:alpha/beta fold hydrolase [Actinomycetota bacterium]